MQIVLKDVNYNKLKNLNICIDDNSITGVVGTLGCGKTDLSLIISKKVTPDSGVISYDCDLSDNKIGVITSFSYNDMLYGNVLLFIKKYSIKYNYKMDDIDNRVLEILKMVGLNESILTKSIFNISKSEKIKVLLASILLYNPELIVLDNIVEELDNRSRTKLFKLIIKLKRFYNKTIIITSSDVNIIYELVDSLIILDNGNVLSYGNKFNVYKDSKVLNNSFISSPTIIEFTHMIEDKKKVSLGNNDCINELIKAIYREIRWYFD